MKILRELTEKQPLSREEKKMIKDLVMDYIRNKEPHDLLVDAGQRKVDDRRDPEHTWLFLNDRNQVQWNWRNSEYPFWLAAKILDKKHKGLFDRYIKTPGGDKYSLEQSVKNSKLVKDLKAELRTGSSDKMRANDEAELKKVKDQIKQLRQKQKDLEAKLGN